MSELWVKMVVYFDVGELAYQSLFSVIQMAIAPVSSV